MNTFNTSTAFEFAFESATDAVKTVEAKPMVTITDIFGDLLLHCSRFLLQQL